MNEQKEQKKSIRQRFRQFRDRIRSKYRLVIMRPETLEEVASYRLTLLNLYILISSALVAFGLIVVLLIAFTPLREYVPGYGEVRTSQELIRLHQEVRELERTLVAQKVYMDNMQRVMTGNVVTEEQEMASLPELDNLDSLASPEVPDLDLELREEAERLTAADLTPNSIRLPNTSPSLTRLYFVSPLSGAVSFGFSPERNHLGVDVLAPKNTPIKAALDGYVFFSDWTLETGNTIGIQHSNNIITFYKHNSALLKKAGSFVKAGEAIAIIGNTGTLSDGPHLHFELWLEGKAIDPTQYIQF